MKYVLAIDQGTTGSTALIIDEDLQVVGKCNREFPQLYPQPGWVEHDLEDIWKSVCVAVEGALKAAKVSSHDIACIGITNQRETTAVWERNSLTPVRNAIVWQDRRTAAMCNELKGAGHEAEVIARTGLILDPYFSGTKLRYILDEDADRKRRATTGELAFGTIDSYLVARLTGGAQHITDVTNASRTLLFNLNTLAWDETMLDMLGIPRELLPEVKASSAVYGETRGTPHLRDGIPISGIAGDQQAALFGQACFEPGSGKCTYGTGAFILVNTGAAPVRSNHGLLTTIAWQVGDSPAQYALEGSAFIAGAQVQWLRDGLGIISSASEIEELAGQVATTDGVVMVPAFAGLGAPHWRPEARALISGITRGTTRAHIARAALEGIALQNYDILKAMENDSGHALRELKVDGGASENNLLMQFQADVLDVPISRPQVVETTALGAACLAGLATGVWPNQEAITNAWHEDRRFMPGNDRTYAEEQLGLWNDAVSKA